MAGRRLDREERRDLQPQHPDRGGLHHAACAAGGGLRLLDQAALLSGLADRRDSGALRGRPHRRVEGEPRADVLAKVLDTDEGARRLGEVALVPHSSPISKSGILFLNTLFDENASCHIALGQCYSKCFVDGGKLTPSRSRPGRQQELHPYRLDDRLGPRRHRRRPRRRAPRAGLPQGRMGLRRIERQPIRRCGSFSIRIGVPCGVASAARAQEAASASTPSCEASPFAMRRCSSASHQRS